MGNMPSLNVHCVPSTDKYSEQKPVSDHPEDKVSSSRDCQNLSVLWEKPQCYRTWVHSGWPSVWGSVGNFGEVLYSDDEWVQSVASS